MPMAGRGAARPSTLALEGTDDAALIAQQMVLDAGAQAARLRQRASVHTAAICETAEREAAMVCRQASLQAAAIREAAERDAEQLRATVMKLLAEPASQPEVMPVPMRAAEPATRLARRPQGPPRQLVAVRVAAAATAALSLFALAAGTTEVALHGFAFFVFRSAGTGETGSGGLQEDQGPGQPDAPRPTPSHFAAPQGTSAQRGRCEQRPVPQNGPKGSQGGFEHCR
jgi:hypothetical protein